MTVLLATVRDWYCPNCGLRDQTEEIRPHSRFHVCPKLRGLTAPMLPVGVRAKVEARVREDYVRDEIVTLDEDRRPVMSVVTTRDDGQDTAVFAALATARGAS